MSHTIKVDWSGDTIAILTFSDPPRANDEVLRLVREGACATS